jgi:hypothetical protein
LRSPHDLKVHPAQTDNFELWLNVPPAEIVAPDWCRQLLRREKPSFRIVMERFQTPEFDGSQHIG